jgi:hypothetical protein
MGTELFISDLMTNIDEGLETKIWENYLGWNEYVREGFVDLSIHGNEFLTRC